MAEHSPDDRRDDAQRPVPRRPGAHDAERYAGLLARRTGRMRSSVMRDLMAITARPEVISLAGGLPDTSTFPPEVFASVMTRVAHESSAAALQYGPTEGFAETRDCVLEVMAAERMTADPEDVLITTGGQQAIDLVTKTLVDPGDVILCEAPTYPGAVPTFSSYEADVVQVEMDDRGLRLDALSETLDRLDREGRRPKFLYTVPTFHNPAGVTMSASRRAALVELSRERELLIVEDNPYGLLRYEGEPQLPLYALDGGANVVYLGTLSKILSPGIRLGWLVAPPPILAKTGLGKQGSDLCTSTLTQFMVREYFAGERWRTYVESLIGVYRSRRDAMLDAMAEHFPAAATWTRPEGGLFLWATMPEYIDTTDLLARALRENVAFVPGRGAFLDGRGAQSMRLNFSASDETRIREGIRRIGEVAAEQVGLYETLTGSHQVVDGGAPSDPHRGPSAGRGDAAARSHGEAPLGGAAADGEDTQTAEILPLARRRRDQR